jgi:serine protease AprX
MQRFIPTADNKRFCFISVICDLNFEVHLFPPAMKKIILFLFILGGILSDGLAQSTTSVAPTQYWIQFRDKNNSPYSTGSPLAYLSPRAIQRRLNQSIPIVESDLPVNQNYVDSVVAKGAHIHLRSKWLNGVSVKISSPAQLTAIMSLPFVVGSTEVGAIRQGPSTSGTEKFKPVPSSLSTRTVSASPTTQSLNYGPSLTQINLLNGVCLHNLGFQGQGMVIAILDAGFQSMDTLPAFDSLRVNHQILGAHDFVLENDSVYYGHFHGMCVLSCMGGNLPGQIVGTAPKAKFWLIRTEDAPTEKLVEEYNWAAGAEFADSAGADVINTSLGYTTFDDSLENHTYADMNGHTTPAARAANFAANKGIAVMCAAGNLGGSAWKYIGTPADADSVLAVGSVNGSGVYSSFSSQGPGSTGQIKPAVASEGEGSVVADWNSNGITFQNGTSFASPILCGLVACLWQAHPQLGNMQILLAVEKSASQFAHPDSFLGYGIPDFCGANISLGIRDGSSLQDDFLSDLRPNPFTNSMECIFWSKSAQSVSVNLMDLQGRIVRSENRMVNPETYNSWTVSDLSSIAPGIYMLSVRTGKTVFVRKVVKE